MEFTMESLKDLRIKAKLTQSQAADLCECSYSTWLRREKNPAEAPQRYFVKIKEHISKIVMNHD